MFFSDAFLKISQSSTNAKQAKLIVAHGQNMNTLVGVRINIHRNIQMIACSQPQPVIL